MKQHLIEWLEVDDRGAQPAIDLTPEALETVIALMARALIALVRSSEENVDEQ